MQRDQMLQQLSNTSEWDIIIIGGGASGLGTAVDAARRGYKTLLLEAADFAGGTSSRSTKLIHGGVRYLQQGNISLVRESLRERGLLKKNASHLVFNQQFIIPSFSFFQTCFYGVGLKIYDLLAGALGLGASKILPKNSITAQLPTLARQNLKAGIAYFDAQFDDARLAINLAQTAAEQGAAVLNYFPVSGLLKNDKGMVCGVQATDTETGLAYSLSAGCIINATGVFGDKILQMDMPGSSPAIMPSQGAHIVLDASFLQSQSALMIPKTSDGRVLFAVPWHNKVVVGTTDNIVKTVEREPRALESEIDFLLQTAGRYLSKAPQRSDILSIFAGLRPLPAPGNKNVSGKDISRNHKITVSASGLVSIIGGKWTTYRQMAEDAVNTAAKHAGLNMQKCSTRPLPIHGHLSGLDRNDPLYFYGSDLKALREMEARHPLLQEKLHPLYPYSKACVVWAVHNEMARTVEDVVARRLRLLLLDARAALHTAPAVADIMAAEMNKSEQWKQEQLVDFKQLALKYLP